MVENGFFTIEFRPHPIPPPKIDPNPPSPPLPNIIDRRNFVIIFPTQLKVDFSQEETRTELIVKFIPLFSLRIYNNFGRAVKDNCF